MSDTVILGDFELRKDQMLGKGAWGEVFVGKQVSLNRPVAIKVLKKELTEDPEFVRRFRREAETLAKLVDENIVQVYGAGTYEGSHFFAMEFVHGMSLQKFIERGRKFSPEEVIYVGLAVAKALRSAWESPAQIVHRDIKPSNVMVSFTSSLLTSKQAAAGQKRYETQRFMDIDIKESHIKVMDFGLA
ncbi:MAG: serine/threonine protein kinase [Planctomycetes bacterium]|nr:serine/threonine protein kinase [Planctomycetota bacterium]